MKFNYQESQMIYCAKRHTPKKDRTRYQQLIAICGAEYATYPKEQDNYPLLAEALYRLCNRIWEETRLIQFDPIRFLFDVQPGGVYTFINTPVDFSGKSNKEIITFFKQDYQTRIIDTCLSRLYCIKVKENVSGEWVPLHQLEEKDMTLFEEE